MRGIERLEGSLHDHQPSDTIQDQEHRRQKHIMGCWRGTYSKKLESFEPLTW